MERLIEWLPSHLPPAGPVRLVHGDYRLDNMILDADAPKVLAVLDWELSTLGDPLADFTYHLMQWHMPQEDSGGGTGSLLGFDLRRSAFRRWRRMSTFSRAQRDSIRGRI